MSSLKDGVRSPYYFFMILRISLMGFTLMVHLYLCLPEQCGQKIHKSKGNRRFLFVQFYTVFYLF